MFNKNKKKNIWYTLYSSSLYTHTLTNTHAHILSRNIFMGLKF